MFSAGKTFSAGDVIYLRNGYHGHPTITGSPNGMVIIQPQSGHNPTAKKVVFDDASNFTLRGLEISPEIVSSYEKGNFVTINSDCSSIVLEDCLIYSAASISGWTAQNWLDRAGTGISCAAPDTQIIGNHIKNVRFGINMSASAENSVCSYNTIENFAADGIRGLGNYQVFEYNLIMNAFDVDDNHDDGFQSWTNGPGGVGSGTIYGTVLRGNVIISYTDPNQPLKTTLQGIGCFDGFFEDWIVENNVVCVDQWHGISFYGAINCRFVNNTVVENPIAAFSNQPWLGVFAHKTRGASTGNIVRNNLVRALSIASGSSTVDHNIETTNYTSHFVDYNGFDFHLKSTSSAVDAGITSQAPSIDRDGYSRSAPYDVGAYEFGAGPPPSEPSVIYSEPFDNATDPLADIPPADIRSIYDWTAHTANATLAGGVQVVVASGVGAPSGDGAGYFVYAHGGGVQLPGIVWTDSVSFDPADYSDVKFSLYAANSNAAHQMRVAIRIGSQWYASDTAFSTASINFSGGGEYKELTFDPSGSEWRQLTFNGSFASSGTTLSLAGSTLGSDLPSGDINAVGVYLSTTGSGGNLRFDTFTITAGSIAPEVVAITASSHDGNVPANTMDGNLGTRWSAEGSGEWIQYELNGVFSISGIDIAFYRGDERSAYFDVQVSTNGSSWTTVINDEESSVSTTNLEQFPFTPTSAKFIRYVGDGNSMNQWNSLTEVEIVVSP